MMNRFKQYIENNFFQINKQGLIYLLLFFLYDSEHIKSSDLITIVTEINQSISRLPSQWIQNLYMNRGLLGYTNEKLVYMDDLRNSITFDNVLMSLNLNDKKKEIFELLDRFFNNSFQTNQNQLMEKYFGGQRNKIFKGRVINISARGAKVMKVALFAQQAKNRCSNLIPQNPDGLQQMKSKISFSELKNILYPLQTGKLNEQENDHNQSAMNLTKEDYQIITAQIQQTDDYKKQLKESEKRYETFLSYRHIFNRKDNTIPKQDKFPPLNVSLMLLKINQFYNNDEISQICDNILYQQPIYVKFRTQLLITQILHSERLQSELNSLLYEDNALNNVINAITIYPEVCSPLSYNVQTLIARVLHFSQLNLQFSGNFNIEMLTNKTINVMRLFKCINTRIQYVYGNKDFVILYNKTKQLQKQMLLPKKRMPNHLKELFEMSNDYMLIMQVTNISVDELQSIQDIQLEYLNVVTFIKQLESIKGLTLFHPTKLITLSLKNVYIENINDCINLVNIYTDNTQFNLVNKLQKLRRIHSLNDEYIPSDNNNNTEQQPDNKDSTPLESCMLDILMNTNKLRYIYVVNGKNIISDNFILQNNLENLQIFYHLSEKRINISIDLNNYPNKLLVLENVEKYGNQYQKVGINIICNETYQKKLQDQLITFKKL